MATSSSTAVRTATPAAATKTIDMPSVNARRAAVESDRPAAGGSEWLAAIALPTDWRARVATAFGAPTRCEARWWRYPVARMLPRTATPRAPPTSRVVSLTAEPTPALANGIDSMIAPVAGAVVSAMPAPNRTRATATDRYALVGDSVAMTSMPPAMRIRPVPITRLRPYRSANGALRGAITIIMPAIGRMAAPARKGE